MFQKLIKRIYSLIDKDSEVDVDLVESIFGEHNPQCGSCGAWNEIEDRAAIGTCHRHPPAYGVPTGDKRARPAFPETNADDGCFDFIGARSLANPELEEVIVVETDLPDDPDGEPVVGGTSPHNPNARPVTEPVVTTTEAPAADPHEQPVDPNAPASEGAGPPTAEGEGDGKAQ